MKKFYSLFWIRHFLKFYTKQGSLFLGDKEIKFSPHEFLLSLFYIYKESLVLGASSEIESLARRLKKKQEFDFMELVDLLRKDFAKWFQDLLLGKPLDFSFLRKLSFEFLMLEEQMQKQIQIPLLDKLKKFLVSQGEILEEENVENYSENKDTKREEVSEDKAFKIFLFFKIVEGLSPSKREKLIKRAEKFFEKKKNSDFSKKALPELEELFECEKALKAALRRLYEDVKKGEGEKDNQTFKKRVS